MSIWFLGSCLCLVGFGLCYAALLTGAFGAGTGILGPVMSVVFYLGYIACLVVTIVKAIRLNRGSLLVAFYLLYGLALVVGGGVLLVLMLWRMMTGNA